MIARILCLQDCCVECVMVMILEIIWLFQTLLLLVTLVYTMKDCCAVTGIEAQKAYTFGMSSIPTTSDVSCICMTKKIHISFQNFASEPEVVVISINFSHPGNQSSIQGMRMDSSYIGKLIYNENSCTSEEIS